MPPEEVAERIARTFYCRDLPEVERAEGQAPGNFVLRFVVPQEDGRTDDSIRIVALGEAAVVNMVAGRDARHRLQLLGELERVQACGEFHMTPTFEWRLLRLPQLTVRPAPKMSPLARVGPVPGIGPALPRSGPRSEGGHRLAVALELEATRLHQRTGKQYRGGKAVRSWLVSWLPSTDSLDLALLLTFWSKGMSLHEDLMHGECGGATAYSSITVGQGLVVHFPEDAPLLASDLQELRAMHSEVRSAHRTGMVYEDRLPRRERLRDWGRMHLAGARIATEQPLPSAPLAAQYTHHLGHGAVTLSEAPSRFLGVLGPGPPLRTDSSSVGSPRAGLDELQAHPGGFSRPPRAPPCQPRLSGADVAAAWRSMAKQAAPQPAWGGPDGPPPPFSVECIVEPPRPKPTPEAVEAAVAAITALASSLAVSLDSSGGGGAGSALSQP